MTAATPSLARRLANFRAARGPEGDGLAPADPRAGAAAAASRERTERLAAALDAELIVTGVGSVLRIERPAQSIPIDRDRLQELPGQPPRAAPLVCLDTETTGLATAAGTLAFLVGLGWWEGARFRQVQLLLPDHADEPALLDLLAGLIPADAWLVTYNGRGFDWPLLVTRYRMIRRPAPPTAGHLDLLPLVRRVFRHRLPDARLRTVEAELLGVRRIGDVEGWEIPTRYFDVLRGAPASTLLDVVRHNDEDVRSLARLLAHVERDLGDDTARRRADPGDLAGLARAFARDRRLDEAIDCLDLALCRIGRDAVATAAEEDEPWWSPRRRADFGGRPARVRSPALPQRLIAPWSEERLLVERAHLLRRVGRHADAADTWRALATGTGRLAAVAAIELAKACEHRLADLHGARAAVERGWRILDRRRRLGRPEPRLEADLVRRAVRLGRRGTPTGRPALAASSSGTPQSSSEVHHDDLSTSRDRGLRGPGARLSVDPGDRPPRDRITTVP